jgi:opacity protein-like surface antigen
MKQLYLLLLMIISTITAGYSQRFEGGVLGGLNASQVDGDTHSGYNKPGIVAGTYVINNFSDRLFAGMEIKYAQKGSRKNPNFKTGDQDKYIIRLSYIDIPVYLGYKTSDRTSILAGVSAGYLINSQIRDNYGPYPEQPVFNDFDLQGMLGFRFRITNRLAVDLRGAYSLVPIRENPGKAEIYWLDSQFNNLLSTTVLYRLDF